MEPYEENVLLPNFSIWGFQCPAFESENVCLPVEFHVDYSVFCRVRDILRGQVEN